VKIKFNNIRNLADARYAAATMAEWIGFTVGLPDSLPIGKIQEIIGWCAGPKMVLEAAEGIGSDILFSFLQVLPVDGIEVEKSDFKRLHSELIDAPVFWIVKSEDTIENTFSHTLHLVSQSNSICRILPKTSFPHAILDCNPFGISVNCEDADLEDSEKLEVWNKFFEDLEIF